MRKNVKLVNMVSNVQTSVIVFQMESAISRLVVASVTKNTLVRLAVTISTK